MDTGVWVVMCCYDNDTEVVSIWSTEEKAQEARTKTKNLLPECYVWVDYWRVG